MNAVELLAFLVATPSVSGSEQQLADQLREILSTDGFAVQREGHSLWFSLGREARPHLLFVSHLDTVPACAGWASEATRPVVADGKLTGLGANDAKGCVAAMILAARELRGNELGGRVTFAFVAQEETTGEGIRATRSKLGEIDAAVVGEPTGLEICAAQRGILILKCTARGEGAHVAHASLGDNAIHKAARDIARLAEMEFEPHPVLGTTQAQVTKIGGGLALNQVPDACEFFVDFRTTPNLNHAKLAAEIGAALESEVAIQSERYLSVATDLAEPIVRAALAASGRARAIGSATASDWAFLSDIPAVKAGPGDSARSHRPNEYLLLTELDAGAKFYGRLAHEYFARITQEAAHV